MAMHNQNVNHSGDLRVDDDGQYPEPEVFPYQPHSEEYPETSEPQGDLNLFTNDNQYQYSHPPIARGYHGAGYNGEGLSADEYKASEGSYGYRAPYASYHRDRSSTSQQPSREATPSNDNSHREDQDQDHTEHVEDNVQGDNCKDSARHSTSRRGGKSCVSLALLSGVPVKY